MANNDVQRIIIFGLVITLSLSSISAITGNVLISTASATGVTGVMVPLYTYPTSSTWDLMVQTKSANANVPTIAIINPGSGPGTSQNSDYVAGIQKLQSGNITVLGYVYTSYGSRSISLVESDIDKYNTWYNLDGIFFDEMSNVAGKETYYQTLSNYADSLGLTITVGNPGTDTISSYVGTVDNIIIYESAGLPSLSSLGGWHSNYDKANFSVIPYAVSSLDQDYVVGATSYTGFIYITNDNLPNPWDSLPPYYPDLVSTVDAANSGTFVPPPPMPEKTITVNSVDLKGKPFVGMWTTVTKDGVTVQTGYTPLSFSAQEGQTYVITVASYRQHIFEHWDNGSTNRERTITATQDMTLIAYYKR
jgi:hypothetical protein